MQIIDQEQDGGVYEYERQEITYNALKNLQKENLTQYKKIKEV